MIWGVEVAPNGDADGSGDERDDCDCHPQVVLMPCSMTIDVNSASRQESITTAESNEDEAEERHCQNVDCGLIHRVLVKWRMLRHCLLVDPVKR